MNMSRVMMSTKIVLTSLGDVIGSENSSMYHLNVAGQDLREKNG
jgi:hypothetical protein